MFCCLIITLQHHSCNYLHSILSVGMAHNNTVKKVSNTPQQPPEGKKTNRYLINLRVNVLTQLILIFFNIIESLDVMEKNSL